MADQVTKAWIDARPDLGFDPIIVIPGIFEIVSWRNPGALFSILAEASDPWRRIVLIILPIVAISVIAVLLTRTRLTDRLALLGYSLVLGGAMGNLLDRVFRSSVVDFLRFGIGYEPMRSWLDAVFGNHYWPAFNIADSAICVGATAIAFEIFRGGGTREDGSTVESKAAAPASGRDVTAGGDGGAD